MNMHPRPKAQARNPWVLTASGMAFDLINPTPEMVRWADVAESLARLARFNGHISAGAYSVAQHCVLGAEALLEETGNPRLAGLFLLHDAHEAYVGDITSPVQKALGCYMAEYADRGFHPAKIPAKEDLEYAASGAIARMKRTIDAAIYGAAGAGAGPTSGEACAIHLMDQRMLATEMRQLWARAPMPVLAEAMGAAASLAPVRLKGRIRILPWPDAASAYLRALHQFFPHLKA